ncbi:DUF4249 domain-containing protein [Mangrovibacterium diazotrophicum]|uniref:Uncharacterized protein DUF4249 n=1 Tax=Mangrovibacterium diazotrophicum TaxID=1261403 RepID=A0A419W7X9_9BACT|nr:DUF4249 domain-containing protein [Mangrovibacterium diazotrophicum]RKD91569.1 uncharacterized protein DUF4249 [Mangrovibacterium diazotrophicum]
MQINKTYYLLFVLGFILNSCVERYFPDTETNFTSKIVIEGTITTEDEDQQIVVSMSSSVAEPEFVPVSGCEVYVEDEDGNKFTFSEGNAGYYNGRIPDSNIVIGMSYRLYVKTPDGDEYRSKYEELMPCPDVDSIYTEVTSKETTDPDVDEDGLQFYVDLKADDTYGRFYRFGLIETYEYHADFPLDKWVSVDNVYTDLVTPDYSNQVCYVTDSLASIYVLSTDGFSQNSYSGFELHFVNDHTQRLLYKYSLLLKQYSMTESAYSFWKNLKENNQESVDLFGRQPASVKGNVYNINDTTEYTLGYFGVSAVRTKRVMVYPDPSFTFSEVFHCKPVIPDPPIIDRPIYYAVGIDETTGESYTGIVGEECIFCQTTGGTTEKPSYWDE